MHDRINHSSTCSCRKWMRPHKLTCFLRPWSLQRHSFNLASPPCIRTTALSHPSMYFTWTEALHANYFFGPAHLVAAGLKWNQHPHTYPCNSVTTERHQESAALHCGTPVPVRFCTAAPGRRPSSQHRRAKQTHFLCRRAYLKVELR